MIVKLGTYSGSPVSINKTASFTDYTGYFRDAENISKPTVQIERDNPIGFNYMYIPDLNRYYFVSGVSTVVTNLIAVTGVVDVAMSFKNDFLNWDVVVRRNENRYNMLLDDGIFKAYQNSKHKVIAFPREMTEYSYILALGGNS